MSDNPGWTQTARDAARYVRHYDNGNRMVVTGFGGLWGYSFERPSGLGVLEIGSTYAYSSAADAMRAAEAWHAAHGEEYKLKDQLPDDVLDAIRRNDGAGGA